MVLSFRQYMGYLYGIGAAILVVIIILYYLIIWRRPNLFHKTLHLMFHIEVYDPNDKEKKKKTDSLTTGGDTTTAPAPTKKLTQVQAFEFVQPSSARQTLAAATRSLTVETQMPTVAAPPAPKKYLDLYGKYIHAETFLNRFFLAIIIVVLLFSVTIAFYQGIFLANMTVYPGDPCPSNFIQMDCYFGSEQTYFNCTQGQQTDPQFVNGSAMCFRWIVRDVSVNDVMTQFGACYGLLNAFLAITQAVLRYLIYCSTKRSATDDDGKNKTSKPTQNQIAGTSAASPSTEEQKTEHSKSKYVYKHDKLHHINIGILYLLMGIAAGGAIALGFFKISTTILTYVVLATIVILACIAFVWVTRIDAVENDIMEKDSEDQSLSEVVGDRDKLKEAGNTIISFLSCGKNK